MQRLLHISVLTIAIFIWGTVLPVLAADCTGQTCLQNPLKFPDITRFVEGVLQAVIIIALPIITIFIVWAGFLYISARGKVGQIERAHKNFQYVIIGSILLLSAWVLATLIGGTLVQLLG